MLRSVALASVALVVAVWVAAPAVAAPDTPIPGYTFCGWQDPQTKVWTDTNPQAGAYVVAFARDMSCPSARRNVDLMRLTKKPPYRAVRTGYDCVTLKSSHESRDTRCRKYKQKRTFRYRSGS